MNIIKYYLILAIAAGLFCAAVSGHTEQPLPDDKPVLINQPHPAVDGIEKLHVVVLQYDNTPENDVQFWKQLEANAKEKLHRAGIESETPTADNILSISELRIYISTLSLEDLHQYVFHIRTALARAVCLKDKRNPVFKSDIWQATPVMQTVSVENMRDKVTEVVLEQVQSFIHTHAATKLAAKQSSEAIISESDSPATPESQTKTDTESTATRFWASKSSTIFHKPECRWAKNISAQNLVSYTSKDEAMKTGKRPCKTCNP